MKEKEWDFFMVMLESSDPLQHELWRLIDKNHPRFDPNADEYAKQAIPTFYKLVDQFLGEVFETLPDTATVCIMSDHGFGPLNRYFLVNNFLMDIGLLQLKDNLLTKFKKVGFSHGINLQTAYALARKMRFGKVIAAFRGGSKEKALNRLTLSFQDVDWSRTKAFGVGTGGHIYLNVTGREPEGIVRPGKEYQEIRRMIVEKLTMLVDPETGEKAIEQVFVKEDLYKGKFADSAPDITFFPTSGFSTLQRDQFISPAIFFDSPKCGTHCIDGVCFFYGPDIAGNKQIDGARIIDLAPTFLHLFGEPIPEDMDGTVLKDVFKEGSQPSQQKVIQKKNPREKRKIRTLRQSGRV